MNTERIKKMRISMELEQLQRSQQTHGITCSTTEEDNPENYTKLEASIPGPKGSPYECGTFKFAITFGEQYPFHPPGFKFITPVYHINIDNSGRICLNSLLMPPTGSYNPAIALQSILLSIQLLLANRNPDDPLQGDAADLYKSNRDLFNQTVREHVAKHCLPSETKDSTVNMETETPDDSQDYENKDLGRKLIADYAFPIWSGISSSIY